MRVYFLGIGGIGMSAIARYLNTKGDEVMGYDRTPSPLTHLLEQEGIKINYQDVKENVPDNIDLVIYTPAIPQDSQQLQEIQRRHYPIEKRSVALGHITKDKKVLAVAGTHGKTTTSGMIAHILSNSSVGCSAFLGGILKGINNNFIYCKHSDYVVVEADEYDRSFLQLNPLASVITAIDEDHMDIYKTYSNLYAAFEQYALQTKKDGLLLVRKDNKQLIEDLKDVTPMQTYCLEDFQADNYMLNLRISKGTYYFDYFTPEGIWYDIHLTYPGRHNVENAVAAITICNFVLKQEGLNLMQRQQIIRTNLESFSGMYRRLDYHIRTKDKIFIDDYAHHPKEITTTINSLRQMYPNKHFTGVFQPHLYTRTRDLADEFARALELLDTVILLPIYPAREEPIQGVSSHLLLHKINKMDKYLVSKEQLMELLEALNPEFLITFGAGDIDRLVPEIENILRENMSNE